MEKTSVQNLVMENLNNQRKYGRFCDIRLSVGNQFTWIHSAIMCSVSSIINKQCCNALKAPKVKKSFSFSSPLTIKLTENDNFDCFSCLQNLIDFIYGRKVAQDSIHSCHIADLYKLLNLSDVLINIINREFSISDQNVANDDSSICNVNVPLYSKEKTTDEVDRNKFSGLKQQNSGKVNKTISGKMQCCIECKYKCYKPGDLLAHLRNTGHGEDVCSLCFVHLSSFQELNNHYNLHDHPKPFFCTFCDVRFQSRTLLNLHLPRHSTETPYVCPHCNKGFKWKNGLTSHLVIHSNEKKHLCDECGFSTTHAKTLKAHKLTHTGELFRCTHPGCTHMSSRKENMKIHLGTHNNDRPFVCEICGHKFTQSKSLKRHALKHSDRGYSNLCPHCPFKALRSDNLKSHILRHHTEKPLNLEFSEHFTEPLINADCELDEINNDLELKSSVKSDGDLSVLADAASSRTKIQDTNTSTIKLEFVDANSMPRNFDNLIANPVQIDVNEDNNSDVINIDGIKIFVLCNENGESQYCVTLDNKS